MNNPLVTVIVPTFNYGHLIPHTLDSLLEQSHRNWECLVVDDGSTDNTPDVVQSYAKRDQRFIYLHQPNQGPNSARNRGIELSKGSFVQFLDSDDLLELDKLRLQVETLSSQSTVDILYSDVRFFWSDNPQRQFKNIAGTNQRWMPETSGQGEPLIKPLLAKNIMVMNAPLIRKSVFDRVGLFNEQLQEVEDWEYWFRCAVAGCSFQYDTRPGTRALVRIHSTSRSKNNQKMFNAYFKLVTIQQTVLNDSGANHLQAPLRRQAERNLLGYVVADLNNLSQPEITQRIDQITQQFPSIFTRLIIRGVPFLPLPVLRFLIKLRTLDGVDYLKRKLR